MLDAFSITTAFENLFLIGFLAFLESILSVDNALVLAIIASRLPKEEQRKALIYGLAGAVVFRLIALTIMTYLIKWSWVKFAGGGYLVFIALQNLFQPSKTDKLQKNENASKVSRKEFWKIVIKIEILDMAFAVDSILAAVAVTPKIWIVFIGGLLGIIAMRYAASVFLKLLTKFPHFEKTAYHLILIIGIKLILEGFHLKQLDFHSAAHPAFWIFWGSFALALSYGFFGDHLTNFRKKSRN